MLVSNGALIQLGNDIYDVYKDLHEGIHTLPTDAKSGRDRKRTVCTNAGV
ncbi:MAG: hypothetical protein IPI77_17875 [Saprospiraceae bacterium]|nr:hypothetical protein [Saprospiraceae bacterium]